MKSRRNSALEEASVDMSPMIDMTFLLLIFFIVNMNFTKETGIEVKRPTAATGEAKTGDVIMVGRHLIGHWSRTQQNIALNLL